MKRFAIALTLLIIVGTTLAAVPAVKAARPAGLAILVDLSHKQNTGGLDLLMKIIPEAYWIVLVATQEDVDALPDFVKTYASEIRVGGFTSDNLDDVDMVIIGMPQAVLSDDEVTAIKEWFNETPKGLWLAADSDYPAQGSELSQQVANTILEAIGAKLRMDYVSVEDYESFAARTYRVIGLVDPPPEVAELGYAAEKVLFHGPGAVAVEKPDGTWANPITDPEPNVYVVVHTSSAGKIVEHQPSEPGAPGNFGVAYVVEQEGVFPLLAVEIMDNGNKVVVSGETPYGGYQAMVTWLYYGYKLDGPRFVRNIILWATGYMGELTAYKETLALQSAVSDLQTTVGSLDSAISDLTSRVGTLEGDLSDLEGTVTTLSGDLSNLQTSVDTLQSDLDNLNTDLSGKISNLENKVGSLEDQLQGLSGAVNTPLYVSVLAIILSLVAIGLSFKKK
jgi:uncharacterized coiled-coil protein SlyX